MKTIFITLICLFLTYSLADARDTTLVMFWNVENYFDPFDDEMKNDEDFTPEGKYHWTWGRFRTKRNAIAKTIISTKDKYGDYPVIVGMAEVESSLALRELTEKTPLAKLGYNFIHRESPDARGIDVAMLYREDYFNPLKIQSITFSLPNFRTTRNILYVKGILNNDTTHIFINHWPSKLGGEEASMPSRMAASLAMSSYADSLLKHNPDANIIITGDFNDYPDSEPVNELCKVGLKNLSLPLQKEKKGTLRYKGNWELIDQFMVSSKLFNQKMEIVLIKELLMYDDKYLGLTPHRTYLGPRYQGGVSDHLPIMLIIEKNH